MRSYLTILVLVQFFIFSQKISAQESVLTGGGTATGETGTQTFSIGQVAFRYTTGEGGTITEGVQLPYEILLFEGIPEENGIALTCRVHPNPATSVIRLTIQKNPPHNMNYQLLTLNGNVLLEEKIEEPVTVIPVEKYSEGCFLLRVIENGKLLTLFKIVKR